VTAGGRRLESRTRLDELSPLITAARRLERLPPVTGSMGRGVVPTDRSEFPKWGSITPRMTPGPHRGLRRPVRIIVVETKPLSHAASGPWARLVSNQRPLACEASQGLLPVYLMKPKIKLQSRIPDFSVRLDAVGFGCV
jgi:hypothetical protein